MTKEEEIQKVRLISRNNKMLQKSIKMNQVRHVKEQNEPIFDSLLKKFRMKYAKEVVMNSSEEILKYIKDEI